MNYLQDSFHGDIDYELDQFVTKPGGRDDKCDYSKLKISTITLHGEFTQSLNLQVLYEKLSEKLNVNYDPKNKKSKTKRRRENRRSIIVVNETKIIDRDSKDLIESNVK